MFRHKTRKNHLVIHSRFTSILKNSFLKSTPSQLCRNTMVMLAFLKSLP